MLKHIYEQAGKRHGAESLNFKVSVKQEPLQEYNHKKHFTKH